MIHVLQHAKALMFGICIATILVVGCNRRSVNELATEVSEPNEVVVKTQVVDDPPAAPRVSLVTRSTKSKQAANDLAMDPTKDGWDTEVIGDVVQRQLTSLVTQTLAQPSKTSDAAILAADFSATALRPSQVREKRLLGGLVVRTGEPTAASSKTWAAAAKELFLPLREIGQASVHVKVVRLQRDVNSSNSVATRCLIEVSVDSANQTIEQHLDWDCDWTNADTATPKLQSITARKFQETQSNGRWFADRTLDVVGNQPFYLDQLRYGLNHWLSRIEVTHGMYVFAEYGLAVADVNNDGLEDLYVCQPGGLPNRLLIHQSNGTVRDIASQAGVDWLDHTSSALFVDFDNDGDQDLAIALESRRVMLMANDGEGVFHLAQELRIEDRHVQGLCAADFNNDSLVDLYLTVGFADERARPGEKRSKFSYHDANEGGANVLFQNGIAGEQWKFRNVTREVGLDQNNRRHSLAASWEDFDNDGDQDLYVANDYGQTVCTETMPDRLPILHGLRESLILVPACRSAGRTMTATAGWISTSAICFRRLEAASRGKTTFGPPMTKKRERY